MWPTTKAKNPIRRRVWSCLSRRVVTRRVCHDRLYPIRAAAKHRPIHAFASTLIWTRRPPSMLQELSHMDRITQLQDEIQQLLTIMSSTIAYLTSRANFVQVSADVPITKQRNPEKYDTPEMFEGTSVHIF